MAKTVFVQPGLNAGRLSRHMVGRYDADRYAYGVREMTNFIPMLQGPARKRPGTKYVHDLKEKCWLLPITFSQTDSWVLAFGDGVVKFFTDHGPVLEAAQTITSMTNASPGVFTLASHGLSAGQEVYIPTLPGTSGIAGRYFVVSTVPTVNTFTLEDMWGTPLNTTSSGTYTGSGTFRRLYRIVSPYSISDLTDSATGCCLMSTAQSEDVTYICVPGYQPRKLTRTSSTSWAFSTFSPTGGPFIGSDPDETITVQASAATGNITVTASSAIFTANKVGTIFLIEKPLTDNTVAWESGKSIGATGTIRRSQGHYYSSATTGTTGTVTPSHTEGARYDGDPGVQWTYHHSGYGYGTITAVAGDALSASVTVVDRIPAGAVSSTSTQWSFGAWSDAEGWPTHVCFFRNRLWFGRGTKLWASVPDDFANFADRDAGIVADDTAISIDFRQGYNDQMQWLFPATDLLVGAQGNEFWVGEISTADPIGPGNIAANRGPGYGARRVQPVIINDGVFYVLPAGRVMRELRYAFETDGYVALNKTAFAEDITKGQINRMAFAKEPESVLWACCADGALLGLSFEREHQLMAWHRHTLGGVFGSSGSPVVEDIAVIPSPEGDRDELYVCVKRTINGATKHYLEYFDAHWDEDTQALSAMSYLDSSVSSSSNTSLTVGGLEHLVAQSVKSLGDGRAMGAYTVDSSGQVTLSSSSAPTVLNLGLTYTAEIESMPVSRPGLLVKITRVFARFISTVKAKAGGSTSTDRDTRRSWGPRAINWSFSGASVSSPTPAQSRMIEIQGEGDKGQEVFFKLTHDEPTACTVAGWVFDMEADRA